jgi:hypothetical protein
MLIMIQLSMLLSMGSGFAGKEENRHETDIFGVMDLFSIVSGFFGMGWGEKGYAERFSHY